MGALPQQMMHERQPGAGSATNDAPYRSIAFGAVDIACERTSSALYLRATTPLAAHDPSLARLFRAAVEVQPARLFLAERDGAGWRGLTYEEALRSVDALAQALIERGLSAERPVMILSGNAIDHALLMLAGFSAGIAVAPISPAYSLQSQDHAKLKHIAELIDPGMVYVADTAPFAKALAALALERVEVVASRNGANRDDVTLFQELTETRPGPALEQAASAISADTIAKFLFTSGSTTLPKGVVNTHGMLTSNQQALAQIWPFLSDEPIVLVDWLPWNHTFGGNHNLNLVLRHAGTLYIDGGKPVPALVGETVRNLAEVSPTIYFNVPAGFAAVLPHLEHDAALARTFFARLRLIFYAGAALPDDLWERLEALSARTIGSRVPMKSSWGTTETAPLATAAPFIVRQPGVVGVPVPGVELKLVTTRSKLEVRVRGPNITPGYWRRPELTAAAFDEEGFYKPGDAMRFVDAADPRKGLAFDGRLAEDFKLATGTWVHVGALRVGVLAAASPALADAVIAGENRTCVGLLAWLNAAGCQELIAVEPPLSLPEVVRMPAVREHVRAALARWNRQHIGSSQCVGRVLVLADPPSIDTSEITDKGYINQRLALERRSAEVERLYADGPDPDVIVIEPNLLRKSV